MRIIAGEARGRTIYAPEGRNTRPTLDRVRENMFNLLQGEIPESRVLDLFAGSGALSLEAISRGASSAVLVDSDRRAIAAQRKNIEALSYIDRTVQYCCDWKKAIDKLEKTGAKFDLVFLDPPYSMIDLRSVFSSLSRLIGEDTLLVLEHEAKAAILIPEDYQLIKNRSWGYCAVSVFRYSIKGG